jgi:hypothetical protein
LPKLRANLIKTGLRTEVKTPLANHERVNHSAARRSTKA